MSAPRVCFASVLPNGASITVSVVDGRFRLELDPHGDKTVLAQVAAGLRQAAQELPYVAATDALRAAASAMDRESAALVGADIRPTDAEPKTAMGDSETDDDDTNGGD